jgi:hypothetical protein
MSSYTRVTEEIEIVPPLTWKEIQDKEFQSGFPRKQWRAVKLVIASDEMETDEGTLRRRQGIQVAPSQTDRYKAYDVVADLQEIVDDFPGHEFIGYLEGDGEEPEDLWRVHVVNGKAVKVVPEIVWPEM